MVYFSVVKCPCPRDHPLIKCISVVFYSKDIGDLKAMTTNIFLRICTFVYLIRKMKFQNGIQREPRRGVIPSLSSACRSPQGNFLFLIDEKRALGPGNFLCRREPKLAENRWRNLKTTIQFSCTAIQFSC